MMHELQFLNQDYYVIVESTLNVALDVEDVHLFEHCQMYVDVLVLLLALMVHLQHEDLVLVMVFLDYNR
jgi:hypothetical protein